MSHFLLEETYNALDIVTRDDADDTKWKEGLEAFNKHLEDDPDNWNAAIVACLNAATDDPEAWKAGWNTYGPWVGFGAEQPKEKTFGSLAWRGAKSVGEKFKLIAQRGGLTRKAK